MYGVASDTMSARPYRWVRVFSLSFPVAAWFHFSLPSRCGSSHSKCSRGSRGDRGSRGSRGSRGGRSSRQSRRALRGIAHCIAVRLARRRHLTENRSPSARGLLHSFTFQLNLSRV